MNEVLVDGSNALIIEIIHSQKDSSKGLND